MTNEETGLELPQPGQELSPETAAQFVGLMTDRLREIEGTADHSIREKQFVGTCAEMGGKVVHDMLDRVSSVDEATKEHLRSFFKGAWMMANAFRDTPGTEKAGEIDYDDPSSIQRGLELVVANPGLRDSVAAGNLHMANGALGAIETMVESQGGAIMTQYSEGKLGSIVHAYEQTERAQSHLS